jgi:hypothetical protein
MHQGSQATLNAIHWRSCIGPLIAKLGHTSQKSASRATYAGEIFSTYPETRAREESHFGNGGFRAISSGLTNTLPSAVTLA